MEHRGGLCLALCLLALAACRSDRPAPAPAPAAPRETLLDTLTVTANTQAEIEALRIGVANIWERDFTVAGGATKKLMSAQLWISHRDDEKQDRVETVYPGRFVHVGRYRIQVTHVVKEGDGGVVRFEVWFL